jgi:hypothetical protein
VKVYYRTVLKIKAAWPGVDRYGSWIAIGSLAVPAVRVPRLPQHPACPAFGHLIAAERVTHMLDRLAPLRRAQKLSCARLRQPEAASRRIAFRGRRVFAA